MSKSYPDKGGFQPSRWPGMRLYTFGRGDIRGEMVATARPTRSLPLKDGRGKLIPLGVRIKARNLYVSQGLSAEQVAEACGLDKMQVYRLAGNYGWTKTRKENHAFLSKSVDDNSSGLVAEISEAIAGDCEEIVVSGLGRAKEAVGSLHKDAPKDYQAWTAGIRNLITARNLARGKAVTDTIGGENRSVNLFFFSGAVGAKGIKTVETVDDVL